LDPQRLLVAIRKLQRTGKAPVLAPGQEQERLLVRRLERGVAPRKILARAGIDERGLAQRLGVSVLDGRRGAHGCSLEEASAPSQRRTSLASTGALAKMRTTATSAQSPSEGRLGSQALAVAWRTQEKPAASRSAMSAPGGSEAT